LVIALALMAFILLLLLSMTALVRVESSASALAKNHLLARQNALLGAVVACGELQRALGPDQRATANAGIDTANAANPLWTGVYPTVDPDAPTFGREAVRSWALGEVDWLVSHPESLALDPAADLSADPDFVRLGDFEPAGGDPASDADNLRAYAGWVEIAGSGFTDDGAFAWWAADESQKARFDLIEAEDGPNLARDPQWSRLLPLSADFSLDPDKHSGYNPDLADTVFRARLERYGSLEQTGIHYPDWLERRGHEVTLWSETVPVDVLQGRIKEDLSVYLETGAGLDDTDHLLRGGPSDGDWIGPDFGLDWGVEDLPKAGLLRSFAELGENLTPDGSGGSGKPARAASDQVHGYYPVVGYVAVYFKWAYERVLPVPATGEELELVLLIFPKIALWNPWNAPIESSDYVVEVASGLTRIEAMDVRVDGNGLGDHFLEPAVDWPVKPGGQRHHFVFTLPGVRLEPGEQLIFTGPIATPGLEYQTGQVDASGTLPADLNPLEEGNGFSFFYHRTGLTVDAPTGWDPADTTVRAMLRLRRDETEIPPTFDFTLYARNGNTATPLQAHRPYDSKPQWWLRGANNNALDGNPNMRLQDLVVIVDPLSGGEDAHRGQPYFLGTIVQADSNIRNRLRYGIETNLLAGEISPSPFEAGFNNASFLHFHYQRAINGLSGFNSVIQDATNVYGNDGAMLKAAEGRDLEGIAPTWMSIHTARDLPRGREALVSLGQFREAVFSPYGWQRGRLFGESFAGKFVPRDRFAATAMNDGGRNAHEDFAYLLNLSMMDRFFLSTIPQSGDFDPAVDPLPNARQRIVPDADGTRPEVGELRGTDEAFEQNAAALRVVGGFNVNSTSVEAWRNFLTDTLGTPPMAGQGGPAWSVGDTPTPRFSRPVAAHNEVHGALLNGNRALDSGEIDALATELVEAIRRRGPALSLADFVNRRLIANSGNADTDYQGLMGVLQEAIERGGLNDAVRSFENSDKNVETFTAADLSGTDYPDPEHIAGMPSGENMGRYYGFNETLLQGDLLQRLAPFLTVRGDTFVIRAVGRNADAEAYCELILQRQAEPVDSADDPVAPIGRFGRQFEAVAFRWLDAVN